MVVVKEVILLSDTLYICYGCYWMQGSVYVSEYVDIEKKNVMQCIVSILYIFVSN